MAACMDGVVEQAVASRRPAARRRRSPRRPRGTRRATMRPGLPGACLALSTRSARRARRPDDETSRRGAGVAAGDAARPAAAAHRHAGDPRHRSWPSSARWSPSSGDVAFSPLTLVRWGAQFGPAVASGEWWRLLSSMWLHAASAAPRPERALPVAVRQLRRAAARPAGLPDRLPAGRRGRSAVSLQFQASNGVSVGASGALFGLVGVLLDGGDDVAAAGAASATDARRAAART